MLGQQDAGCTQISTARRVCIIVDGVSGADAALDWALQQVVRPDRDELHILAVADSIMLVRSMSRLKKQSCCAADHNEGRWTPKAGHHYCCEGLCDCKRATSGITQIPSCTTHAIAVEWKRAGRQLTGSHCSRAPSPLRRGVLRPPAPSGVRSKLRRLRSASACPATGSSSQHADLTTPRACQRTVNSTR